MNLLSQTARYAYLRCSIDALVYAHLVRQFGGNHNLALRELRHRFDAVVRGLVADGAAPTPNRANGIERVL